MDAINIKILVQEPIGISNKYYTEIYYVVRDCLDENGADREHVFLSLPLSTEYNHYCMISFT